MPQTEPRSIGLPKAFLITAVAGSLLVVASSLVFYVFLVKAPTDLASATAEGIREFFNFTPRVTINQTVVIEQTNPILEVATVSRDISVDDRWEDEWMGSTKTVELQATFTVKAGFDLREPFTIDIRRYPLSIEAQLPEPQILSLEMKDYKVLRDENGWWNRVTGEDRQDAFYRLQAAAREKATDSGVLEDARETAEERVREIVERNGSTVDFRYPGKD